jgi:hypothetical protein
VGGVFAAPPARLLPGARALACVSCTCHIWACRSPGRGRWPAGIHDVLRLRPATAQRYDDGTIIIRNADGFDFALHTTGDVGTPQLFLHFGFRLAAAADVRAALSRVRTDGIEIIGRG